MERRSENLTPPLSPPAGRLSTIPFPAGATTAYAWGNHARSQPLRLGQQPQRGTRRWNNNGELGDGTTTNSAAPKPTQFTNAIACAAGTYHSLVLLSNGDVYAWGYNGNGQLGTNGPDLQKLTPARVPLSGVRSLAVNQYNSAAVTGNNNLYVWGYSGYGQIGDGGTSDGRQPSFALSGVSQAACGFLNTFAVKLDGTVWAWGDNAYGQLGNGTTGGQADRPQKVPGLSGVAQIAAGYNNVIALKYDGTVWAWGYNNGGQLGLGNLMDRSTPTRINSLSNVTQISARAYCCAALLSNGAVYTWGYNYYGELGLASYNSATAPTLCDGCSGLNVNAVSMGDAQLMTLVSDVTSLSGHITMEGIAPNSPAQYIAFEVRPNNGRPPYTIQKPVSPDGSFSFYPFQAIDGVLHIKGGRYLATNVYYAMQGVAYPKITATLPAGDTNSDNIVDSSDFGNLIYDYGGDINILFSGYDDGVDLNGDGIIDSTDFGLLIGNFGAVGDN